MLVQNEEKYTKMPAHRVNMYPHIIIYTYIFTFLYGIGNYAKLYQLERQAIKL